MSFTGVTFPFQKVTPSDDAIVRRAVITDGILSGCKLTYAGTGLTMEAGYLLICGRQIRHGVTETWDFGGATSGYARLVLTIDATKTSTLDAFDMVDVSVEYATAEDGFYSLIQEDINTSGTKYQATVCIVSLTDGGINAIVQQLPAAAAKGAGGLNFKVVGGTTQPVDPEENMLWVPTPLEITDVFISNAAPLEYQRGTVWIKTGVRSYGQLNIAAEETVMIYPLECWIYADSTSNPTQVAAMTYRFGKWRDWNMYLYKEDYESHDMMGGWKFGGGPSNHYKISQESDGLQILFSGVAKGEDEFILASTKKKVDLRGISRLICNPDLVVSTTTDYIYLVLFISNEDLTQYTVQEWVRQRILKGTTMGPQYTNYTLDVSGYDGSYYIGVKSSLTSAGYSEKAELLLKYIQME
jgi:hypothetical protein